MNIEDIIKLVDSLVFEYSNKHLGNLEQCILKETLTGEKYSNIADRCNCTEGYVKTVASDLWKKLSQQLGEEIKKSNFRATMERLQFSFVSSKFDGDFIGSNNIKICNENSKANQLFSKNNSQIDPKKPYLFLEYAPTNYQFYGREEELKILEKSIIVQKNRLVNLVGIKGIGKTSLAVELVENIKPNFDAVIWLNISLYTDCEEILQKILELVSQCDGKNFTFNDDLKYEKICQKIINYFCKYRCLIIIDELENLFKTNELAGYYQDKYKNYEHFFKMIAEIKHQSCFLLISNEKPQHFTELEANKLPVSCLEIKNLDNSAIKNILKDTDLKDEQLWENLGKIYHGNPLFLQLASMTIQDLFDGNLTEFIENENCFLFKEIKDKLTLTLARLSELEMKILLSFQSQEFYTLMELQYDFQLELSEILTALKSLSRRCLLDKLSTQKNLFCLQPLLRQYIRSAL